MENAKFRRVGGGGGISVLRGLGSKQISTIFSLDFTLPSPPGVFGGLNAWAFLQILWWVAFWLSPVKDKASSFPGGLISYLLSIYFLASTFCCCCFHSLSLCPCDFMSKTKQNTPPRFIVMLMRFGGGEVAELRCVFSTPSLSWSRKDTLESFQCGGVKKSLCCSNAKTTSSRKHGSFTSTCYLKCSSRTRTMDITTAPPKLTESELAFYQNPWES